VTIDEGGSDALALAIENPFLGSYPREYLGASIIGHAVTSL
jgi:hypothetical protein